MDILRRRSSQTISRDSQRNEDPITLILFIILVWTMIFTFRARTPNSEMQLVIILIMLIAVVSHPRNLRQIPSDLFDCLERMIEGIIMMMRAVFMSRNQLQSLNQQESLPIA